MSRAAAARVFFAGASCFLAALPVLAHHSLAAKYDTEQMIMLNGTVTKVDWSNPHARLFSTSKAPPGPFRCGTLRWPAPTCS